MSDYTSNAYPKSRVATFDVGRIGNRKHTIVGLVEADVTLARELIARRVKAGESVGFTAWLLKAIGSTVESNGYVHAVNARNGRQIVFRDVDISIPVEREVHGARVPLAAVIRNANGKTIEEIYAELQALKGQRIGGEKDFVLGENDYGSWNKVFFNAPRWARMAVWKAILSDPFARKKAMGTVMVTNIGMVGNIHGWIVPKTMHNLCVGVGSINKKPWVVAGAIAIREILHLSLLFDHDVVDGSPAARFTAKLVGNIEGAVGLQA